MRYTYSRWNNTQDGVDLDADDLMEALSDDLMSEGDVASALQRVARSGLQYDGEHTPGVQNLLQQLRAERQRELERYDLDAIMRDIERQIEDVVQTEREGIKRRLSDARLQDPDSEVLAMLESIAQRKQTFLDGLPPGVGPQIASLADYEFLDDLARSQFDGLLDRLGQQVLQRHFRTMQQSLQSLTAQGSDNLASMLHGLNDLLAAKAEGGNPDFQQFRESHGRLFPGAESLDDLVQHILDQNAHTESLLQSMSPEMRKSLEETMQSVLHDPNLREELGRMAELLERIAPQPTHRATYPFSGDQMLSLEEALELMRRMQALDELEGVMTGVLDTGDLDLLDVDDVTRLLGDAAGQAADRLKGLTSALESAGYIERRDGALDLTARGIRRIGQKAVQDIFRQLRGDVFGNHPVPVTGVGGDRSDETKRYEFGDAFLLDMHDTLMNALRREGAGSPIRIDVDDFEVYRTEYQTRSATVLMLDMSRSMPLRGCFVAAKKMAFALNSLIRMQFPRDRLHVIGFSDFAREIEPESLHHITWGDYVYGTNMQHGFMLARRLLGREKNGNKQIILITDGEPTAHFEGERVHFAYPPTFRTFQETLREVKRCTREGIVINTFMLERSHYLAEFVNQMTQINRGRAFFATPERLGDYVLVDYVANKRRQAAKLRLTGTELRSM